MFFSKEWVEFNENYIIFSLFLLILVLCYMFHNIYRSFKLILEEENSIIEFNWNSWFLLAIFVFFLFLIAPFSNSFVEEVSIRLNFFKYFFIIFNFILSIGVKNNI